MCVSTGGLAPQALEQEVASATAAALEAIGLTPESWENAVKAIATLGDQLEAVRATEEVRVKGMLIAVQILL